MTNGNLLWESRYSTFEGEAPVELEVDATGNVYVTGSIQSGLTDNLDFLTIKYNSSGVRHWINQYNSPNIEEDEGFGIEVNGDGDVFVFGNTYSFETGFIGRTVVQKINGTGGGTLWVREFSVTNGVEDEIPTAMDLDQNGNIVIAGMTNLSGDFYNIDAFVEKLNPEGTFQWLKTFDGPSDEDFDGDAKLTLDAAGNVYMGATSEGFANPDLRIIKYTPAGTAVWRYRFGNPYFGYDVFTDWNIDYAQSTMLVDGTGNVYVAGQSEIPDQSSDLLAFKLEPVPELRVVRCDFDGDKKADIGVYRPGTGTWYVLNSSNGTFTIVKWGLENDKIVPADYDGDGKYDRAVFRNGTSYVLRSSDGGITTTHLALPAICRSRRISITTAKPIRAFSGRAFGINLLPLMERTSRFSSVWRRMCRYRLITTKTGEAMWRCFAEEHGSFDIRPNYRPPRCNSGCRWMNLFLPITMATVKPITPSSGRGSGTCGRAVRLRSKLFIGGLPAMYRFPEILTATKRPILRSFAAGYGIYTSAQVSLTRKLNSGCTSGTYMTGEE